MYRHESQLYAVIAIGASVLIWKAIDEAAKFFSKDERAAAREHELKMAELKLKQPVQAANPEPLNPVAQDAMDELKKLREARAKAKGMPQPKVDPTTDKVRPFPTHAPSIAAAQAFERNPGAFVFKSVA